MNNIGSLEDEIKEFRIDKEDLEFGEKIGKGGFGFVNKGTYDGEVCAIKQLFIPENCRTPRNKIGLSSYSDEDELWKETLNEIAIMLRVQHSNILNVFGWSDDSQCVYIVMEFLPFSLHKVLETTFPEYDYEPLMKAKKQNSSQLSPTNESSQNGKLKPPSNNINQKQVITPTTKKLLGTGLTIVESPMDDDSDEDEQGEKYKKFLQSQPILSNEMKLQIAIDIAEGMHHLHSRPKPIIHRDLKSHNVLLDKNLISKISDFGLSSVRNRNSGVSGMKGTSGWMAPEMFSSAASSGEKADVYSFGMVIYELLTHLIPFHDVQNPFLVASQVIMGQRPKIENAEKLAKESPIIDCFVRLVSTCCLQDPDDRPTFSQILAELKSIPLQNFLEYTVDINGKGDFTAIQAAIDALPMDITKIIPKRPLPSHSLTKTFSASSMKNSFLDSNSLKKASSFRTGNLGDVGEYEDCGSSGGVMLGTNNPVKSNPLSSLDISLVDKQRLLMQKFNLPFIVRPSDGRKIIKPTRPLTTPIINIRPGVYKEQILIDRSVVLKGISEGKSHAILYKPKDVEDVILFDNVRYSKIRNLIVYNSEYKPNTKSIGKLPHCSVKLKGSKCDATIEKCTFKGVSLEICEKADPTITGNTIRDSPHVGICVHSGAHGTITDNDIFGSLEANILIKDGGNPTIENNQIHNGMSEGIKIGKEGLGNIVNNKIFSNSGSNVYIGSDADPLVMLNKLFTSEKRGIEISANAKGKCRKNRLCGNREEPQILTSTSAKTALKDNEILPLPVEAKPTQSANKSSTTTTAKVTTTTSSSSAGQPLSSATTKVNTNANSGKVTTSTPPKPSSSSTPNTSNTTVSTGSTTTGRQVTTPLKQSQQQLTVTNSSNNVNNTRNSPLSVKSSTRPSALSVKSSDKH